MNLADKARDYAIKMHTDTNCKYGDKPYSFHLEMVVEAGDLFVDMLPVEERDKVRAALWAHDVIEDTRQTYNDVCAILGSDVADIVYAVTNEMGKNRKERAEKTYPKIQGNKWAVFVKCCDRYANTLYSKRSGHSMFNKYRKEYTDFRFALKDNSMMLNHLWDALDELNDQKFHL